MLQRPGQLRIDVEDEVAVLCRAGDLVELEPVKTKQPVGLVKPVLARQRRADQGQGGSAVGDGQKAA